MRGVRLLDLSDTVAGAYAARVLACAGAEVIKVEPPGGDPLRAAPPLLPDVTGAPRSALFAYLNAGKRGAVIDDETPAGRAALDALIAGADAIISSFEGDTGQALRRHARIADLNPRAVHTVVTPFGLTGPYRSYRSDEFTHWAISGYLHSTGDPKREPVQGGGPWTSYACGLTAAVATAAGLHTAHQTGRGDMIDVSHLEAMAGLHQWSIVLYTHQGVIKRRAGNRHAESYHPMGLQRCADGYVCIGVSSLAQWENFCLALDMPELLLDPRYGTSGDRFDHGDDLDAAIAPWLQARTCAEVVAHLQSNRVPASTVLTLRDTLDEEQLRVRDYWAPVPAFGPGARMPATPFRLPGTPATIIPAPELDATASVPEWSPRDELVIPAVPAPRRPVTMPVPHRPLAGVRILELSVAWAGPLAGRWLADLGADVIKVELVTGRGGALTPEMRALAAGWQWGTLAPAPIRASVYPNADPGDRPWHRQGIWNKMNRNKRSLTINLKHPEGSEIFRRMVAVTDIVLDNYSPRAMPALQFDYESLRKINPAIICAGLSGYGATGPYRQRFSWGPILEAHSGFTAATGYGDGRPFKLGHAYPDPIGGLSGTVALLAALWERDRTGNGCFIDMSQYESYLAIGGELLLEASVTGRPPVQHGNRSPRYAPQGVYPCAGFDEWIAISVRDDEEWSRLVAVVDAPGLRDAAYATSAGRQAGHDAIDAVLADWTRDQDKHALMARFQTAGVTAIALFTNRDLVEDPQIVERGFIQELVHPDVGPQRFPGYPVHFGQTGYVTPRGAPMVGGDNDYVVQEILGYAAERVEALVQAGVLGGRPVPA